jgi:phosphatidylglycerol lysyltransferase
MASQPAVSNSIPVTASKSISGESQNPYLAPSYWSHVHAVDQAKFPLRVRLDLLRRFGNFSLAYSTAVQSQLAYFGDNNGYIAYRRRGGVTFALGDPVCPPERVESLLSEFAKAHRRPSFIQIHRDTARVLESFGFFVNEMGIDTRLDLESYNFCGKDKEWLRYAENWVMKRGFRIEEASLKDHEAEILAVSESWRATRTIKRKEVRFLSRPIVMNDELEVRRFFLFDAAGKIAAFVFFDPIYEAGRVSGYVTCIKRRQPDAPQYAESAIMKQAIEQFQREGKQTVWLGLSPLANIENREFRHNRMLNWTSRYYHRARWMNKYFYNFLGHTQYKSRFRGTEVKVHYASPVRFNSYRLLVLASLCGAI